MHNTWVIKTIYMITIVMVTWMTMVVMTMMMMVVVMMMMVVMTIMMMISAHDLRDWQEGEVHHGSFIPYLRCSACVYRASVGRGFLV